MALKPLKVVIGGDTSQLDKALGRAGRNIKGFAIAAAGAAVAAAGGLAVLTRRGLESVDAMAKLSRSMDASINGLRAVQIAASEAGVSISEASTSLQQLSRELVRAEEEGSPAADALKALGLNARALQGLDADDRIAAIADRMKEMNLSAGQASFLLRDLGIRSREMSLLLIQGGDAIRGARDAVREFGLEISQDQAAAIESANDAIGRMVLVFDGLKQKLAVEVAPILQRLADRFNAVAKSTLSAAVERVAKAFGNLAEVILQPEFIDGVASAFEGLANFTAGAAEAFVTASQNVELLTIAFGGLAIALAAVGGPITLIAGALAAALVGVSKWRGKVNDLNASAEAAKVAQENLNRALGTFSETGAPAAAAEAIGYAKDLQTQALAALAAAEANLALAESEVSVAQAQKQAGTNVFFADEAEAMALEDQAFALQEVAEATTRLDNARRTLQALQLGQADRNRGTGGGGSSKDPDEPTLPTIPGLGGGGDVATQMAARLDALSQGLMTERELLEEWRIEGEEALANASEKELEAIGGLNAAKLRLTEEYNQRLAALRQAEQSQTLSSYGTLFGNLAKAFQSGSGKLLKIGKAFSVAQGLINSYRAYTEVLADPSLIGRPFLRTALAASTLASGLAQVANIKSVSESGGGGGAAGGAGSVSTPAQPSQNIVIDLVGETFGRNSVEALFDQINEGLRNGNRIEGVLVR